MSFVNWMIDSLANEDVIDLYFIMSDLVDIELTEAEICETACFDSLASATTREYNSLASSTVQQHSRESRIPIGKQVL